MDHKARKRWQHQPFLKMASLSLYLIQGGVRDLPKERTHTEMVKAGSQLIVSFIWFTLLC